jgi:hypothetical protein
MGIVQAKEFVYSGCHVLSFEDELEFNLINCLT